MSLRDMVWEKRSEILCLATRHGASNVRVFGSVARQEDTADSDVDFLVDMEVERSLLDRIALVQDLEDVLGRKVDVVNARALHWFIREHVLHEAIPL